MKTYQKIKKTSFTCTNKMCENCPFPDCILTDKEAEIMQDTGTVTIDSIEIRKIRQTKECRGRMAAMYELKRLAALDAEIRALQCKIANLQANLGIKAISYDSKVQGNGNGSSEEDTIINLIDTRTVYDYDINLRQMIYAALYDMPFLYNRFVQLKYYSLWPEDTLMRIYKFKTHKELLAYELKVVKNYAELRGFK